MDRFVAAYQKEFAAGLVDVVCRDRPDFEAYDPGSGEKIGIEVSAAYQNEEEAKIQLWAVEEWGHFHGSSNDLLTSLNRVIAKKASKAETFGYSGRLVLAIWLGSLVFDARVDIDFLRRDIVIPENCYADIWLIIRSAKDGGPELYRLQ